MGAQQTQAELGTGGPGTCQGWRRRLAGLSRSRRLRCCARAVERLQHAKPSHYFCSSRKARQVRCNWKIKEQELTASPSKHQGCKARSAPAVASASPHQLGAALLTGHTGMPGLCSAPGSSAGICLVLNALPGPAPSFPRGTRETNMPLQLDMLLVVSAERPNASLKPVFRKG